MHVSARLFTPLAVLVVLVVLVAQLAVLEQKCHSLLCCLQLVHGGSGYSSILSDAWILNPRQQSWSLAKLAGATPPGREMHSAAMVSPTAMLIFGGRAEDGR